MKRLSKLAALLATGALLFGFAACSDGSDGGSSGDNAPQTPSVSGTTYAWTFGDITKESISAEAIASGTNAGKFVLAADYKYKSTPEGLVLTMGKGDDESGSIYNKIDETMTAGSAVTITTSTGAVEPAGDLLVIKNVTGPFTVKAAVAGNSSSDKTDRYAYIKIGEEEVYAPKKAANTLSAAGEALSYTYEGTDKVDVTIGCAKYIRVYDISITTEAAQDQSDGQTITFTTDTKTVENTLTNLGLIGASATSADDSIATVEKTDAGIVVTSVAEGNTTITVTDANSKTASFKAIVAEDGSISIGTITKFTRSAPSAEVTKKASAADAEDGEGTITWDGLTDLEFSDDGETFASATDLGLSVDVIVVVGGSTAYVTDIAAGTYYVRASASDAYEASKNATVTVTVEGAAVTYTIEAAKFDAISEKTTEDSTTPTSTDSETTEIINTLGLALGNSMRIDGNPQRFNVGGSLQKKGKNAIIFTAPTGATTIEVHFYNNGGSAGGRYLQIAEYSDTAVAATNGTEETVASSSEDIVDSFDITAGTKYMLGGSNGLYITKIVIK